MFKVPGLKAITMALLVCTALSVILCSFRGSALPDNACDTRELASSVATGFIKNDDTFKFDGMEDTLSVRVERVESPDNPVRHKLSEMATALSMPLDSRVYTIKATFDCRHSGYGDRTSKILAQVITPHEAELTVVNCQVKSAVMDGRWDMLEEKPVQAALF